LQRKPARVHAAAPAGFPWLFARPALQVLHAEFSLGLPRVDVRDIISILPEGVLLLPRMVYPRNIEIINDAPANVC
jgi:hypothetical protein